MLKTPLFEQHEKLFAKFAPFAGWQMPVQYSGIINEHFHCRKLASVFDICHMGEFFVKAEPEKSGMENIFLFSSKVKDIPVKKAKYGVILNEQGKILDDLVVYRLSEDEWMVVVNAATTEKDFLHIQANLGKDALLENRTDKIGKIDLQGPLSRDILSELFGPRINELRYYAFDYFDILGEKSIISRTGYTGELGYEIYVSYEKIGDLWSLLLKDERVKPAGLGARDTLRLEMGYVLYGQDISEEISPLEAGMKNITLDKEFIGKDALLVEKEAGLKKGLVAIRSGSRRSPRHDYRIFSQDKEIGRITSGSFSPSLGCGIALGYVEPAAVKKDLPVSIQDKSVKIDAVITEKPFLKETSLKK
ncbi:MAG: glycine cleavage system aminomethyltransferase GcvT [Candidatus Omnitrophota bacterium]|nr:glycine cleavage system aminomethyltransferase GcvT [Candidatus Omnitrophota bacterium]